MHSILPVTSQALLTERDRLNVVLHAAEKGRSPGHATPSSFDDLTKIRGIDACLERRLHTLDVWTFDQIVQWTAADVHHIAATLGLGRQISAQNWIEQAALLARLKPRPAPSRDDAVAPAAEAATGHVPASEVSLASLPQRPSLAVTGNHPVSPPPRPLPPWAYAGPKPAADAIGTAAEIVEPPDHPAPPPRPVEAPSIAATLLPATEAPEIYNRTAAAEPVTIVALGVPKRQAIATVLEPPPLPSCHATPDARQGQTDPTDKCPSTLLARDDYAALRGSTTEASVEIVRHPSLGVASTQPPPLPGTAVQSWRQDVQPQAASTAGTKPGPIGRFLKALSGN